MSKLSVTLKLSLPVAGDLNLRFARYPPATRATARGSARALLIFGLLRVVSVPGDLNSFPILAGPSPSSLIGFSKLQPSFERSTSAPRYYSLSVVALFRFAGS